MAQTLKDLAQSFNGCTWHSGKYFLHFPWPGAEIKGVRKIIFSRKISEKLEVCFHPMFSVESLQMLKLKNLRSLILYQHLHRILRIFVI